MGEKVRSKEEWLALADATVATLRTLSPAEFYDEEKERYHPVVAAVGTLARSLAPDLDRFRTFLRAHRAREAWLPLDPALLSSMEPSEIHLRLQTNLADERWVDGALAEPFETGSLVAALERLAASIDMLELDAG